YYYDRDGVWSALGQRLLRTLQLNEPDDLISWVQSASKTEVAALAREVFKAAAEREKIAVDILAGAASSLAKDAAACARRLVRAKAPVQFVFAGSVLLKQPAFAKQVAVELRKSRPVSAITHLRRESVWGAVELARQLAESAESVGFRIQNPKSHILSYPTSAFGSWTLDSPTEQRHPRSMNLDK